MARLSARDEQRAAEAIAAIGELPDAPMGALDAALPLVRELIDAPFAGSYRLRASEEGTRLEWDRGAGVDRPDEDFRTVLEPFFARMNQGRGHFDPTRPPARQRNRAINIAGRSFGIGRSARFLARSLQSRAPSFVASTAEAEEAAHTLCQLNRGLQRLGVTIDHNLRVLLCDGDRLVRLVGLGQDEPFTERQRLLLQRLTLPLRDRLRVERRIGSGRLEHAGAVAALEHVPAGAFVLDEAGRVVHANAIGRHRLEVQGSAIRLALLQAVRGGPKRPDLVMTKLAGPGLPTMHLAICGSNGDRVRCGIERARELWRLTARETDVLAELAEGRQNREIAERLGAAPRTVELHVSSILRKAYADNRCQLIIDLWHLADAA